MVRSMSGPKSAGSEAAAAAFKLWKRWRIFSLTNSAGVLPWSCAASLTSSHSESERREDDGRPTGCSLVVTEITLMEIVGALDNVGVSIGPI